MEGHRKQKEQYIQKYPERKQEIECLDSDHRWHSKSWVIKGGREKEGQLERDGGGGGERSDFFKIKTMEKCAESDRDRAEDMTEGWTNEGSTGKEDQMQKKG